MPKKSGKQELNEEVKMIIAINEALSFKDKNPNIENEKILKHVTNFVKKERDKKTEMAMIAAASKAVSLAEKYDLTNREIIRKIMPQLKKIMENVD